MVICISGFTRQAGAALVLLAVLNGCASLGTGDPRDPIENVNRSIFSFNEFMDEHLFDPIGRTYKKIVPGFLDRGITNFFSNIDDITVIANDILQFKLDQTVSDLARFVFNSTIGIGGFFDVSSHIGLPKHHEDLGQTLAVWGFGPGPYLVAPLLGPTTVRDATGFAVQNTLLSPVGYINNDGYRAGIMSTAFIDVKADLLSAMELIGEAALDRYEFTKNAYLERRESQVRDIKDDEMMMPPADFE